MSTNQTLPAVSEEQSYQVDDMTLQQLRLLEKRTYAELFRRRFIYAVRLASITQVPLSAIHQFAMMLDKEYSKQIKRHVAIDSRLEDGLSYLEYMLGINSETFAEEVK